MDFRVGFGYDSHRLAAALPLIIGGVRIPFEKGFVAHSDGDLLLHAVCDALLGAAALGDIGTHFPDTNPLLKGIDSQDILCRTLALLTDKGWKVNNVDATIVIQQPKMSPFIDAMRDNIAQCLQMSPEAVSVKAKTNEKMDAVGRGEGAEAYVVASLVR
ncbi:MAG: 2-C-methyl-D-erythritol 2,4-cyclodiphosphate synthase [Bacteroidales bacterium]|nr:2-C-methyl-D-erythritol 2,4-cyclodiphosphate synthase [Bacteroidales bacterium]